MRGIKVKIIPRSGPIIEVTMAEHDEKAFIEGAHKANKGCRVLTEVVNDMPNIFSLSEHSFHVIGGDGRLWRFPSIGEKLRIRPEIEEWSDIVTPSGIITSESKRYSVEGIPPMVEGRAYIANTMLSYFIGDFPGRPDIFFDSGERKRVGVNMMFCPRLIRRWC